jgi:hypothetical protein
MRAVSRVACATPAHGAAGDSTAEGGGACSWQRGACALGWADATGGVRMSHSAPVTPAGRHTWATAPAFSASGNCDQSCWCRCSRALLLVGCVCW